VHEGEQFLDAILSFMAPAAAPPQGNLGCLATDPLPPPQLQPIETDKAASRRLAICCAPILWRTHDPSDCDAAEKVASESIRAVDEAAELYRILVAGSSTSEARPIRSRLLEISDLLRAARARMRSHRYNHSDEMCKGSTSGDADV
jgi:hypothetical protein